MELCKSILDVENSFHKSTKKGKIVADWLLIVVVPVHSAPLVLIPIVWVSLYISYVVDIAYGSRKAKCLI